MSTVTVKIEGVDAINARLAKLPPRIVRKLFEGAVRYAVKPLTSTARSKVPVDLGLLKRALGVQVKRNPRSVVLTFGARRGFDARIGTRTRGRAKGQPVKSDPVRYLHLVEKGTSGAPAKPFLLPAYELHKEDVATRFAAYMERGLDKEAAALAKEK